jgi:hypothetical protein
MLCCSPERGKTGQGSSTPPQAFDILAGINQRTQQIDDIFSQIQLHFEISIIYAMLYNVARIFITPFPPCTRMKLCGLETLEKMRQSCGTLILFFSCTIILTVSATGAPTATTYLPVSTSLFRRQACIDGFYACDTQSLGLDFANTCCQSWQVCALDAGNKPACCPAGYVFPSPQIY